MKPPHLLRIAGLAVVLTALGCSDSAEPDGRVHGLAPAGEATPEATPEPVSPTARRVGPIPRGLTDIDGDRLAWPPPNDAGPTVLLVLSRVCPIANGYAPEIARLAEAYEREGVRFWLVYPEPRITADRAREHARDYRLPGRVVVDADQSLTHAVEATITPEAVLVLPGGEIAYQGRIDDLYTDLGVRRTEARETDLRDALDAVLAGRPAPVARTEPVGCVIEQPLNPPVHP